MRTKNNDQPIAEITEVKLADNQLLLEGRFTFTCVLPEQDERLPEALEQAVEAGGQEIKRRLFQQALEHAELELLVAQRKGAKGQGYQRRGRKRYPFKAVFGTVRMRRQQVKQKADGRVVLPSAQAWQTPERMCITAGLRAAVCDGMLEQSVRKTAARVAERAGEERLLSAAEIVNIVHEEGERLQAAQQERAQAVLKADAEAARQLLPPLPEAEAADKTKGVAAAGEAAAGEAAAEVVKMEDSANIAPEAENTMNIGPPWGFPGSRAMVEAVACEQPRQVDPGCVMVQPDEVKVHAQAQTGRKELLTYTTVVMTSSERWHFAAASAAALMQQVAALLAVLGVHQGKLALLFLADGARWIRNWFEYLQVPNKTMILCWYHLVKKCETQLSLACKGRQHREQVQAEVLGHLWEGRVDEALAVLECRRAEMRVALALDQLVEYLKRRRPYLPNYKERQQAGLWIASNRVEKFNDWSVTERCKHQGMAWTERGVTALAAMEAARRNRELDTWRQTGQLTAWTERQAA
jgi:uncharacterized protein UPF0236